MSLGKVNSHGNNSSSIASTSSSTERKSADFSISAILSDDTGSSSQRVKVTPVRGRECQTSSGVLISPPGKFEGVPICTLTGVHVCMYVCRCIVCRAKYTDVHPISLHFTLPLLTPLDLPFHTNHCHTHFSLGK